MGLPLDMSLLVALSLVGLDTATRHMWNDIRDATIQTCLSASEGEDRILYILQ